MKEFTRTEASIIAMDSHFKNQVCDDKLKEILEEIKSRAESGIFFLYKDFDSSFGGNLVDAIVCKLRLLDFNVSKVSGNLYGISWFIWNKNN